MPGGSSKSRFMQRCVADVAGQGKELGSAFAICTAQSQKAGYSEPGSTKQTGKGKAREKFFKKQPDMGKKAGAYEKAVQAGRKAEDMAAVFATLDEADERPLGRVIGRVVLPNGGRVALFERTERDGSNSYEVSVGPGAGSFIYVSVVDLQAANKLLGAFAALKDDILGVRTGRV
jgi:hypothetical protein